jgi:hypothetical protein
MSDPVERSDALDERLAGSVAAIEALTQSGRHQRIMLRVLTVSLVLDIVLSVGLGFVAFQAQRLAAEATSLRQQQRATCLAGNEARAGQITLWHHVLSDFPATAPRTEEQAQQAHQFALYVENLFKPRNCSRI